MELKFQVATKIQKPVEEVFDAVYNNDKLSGYFTNGGASSPLDEGTTVEWGFADTPGQEIKFPVEVERSVKNELIVLRWQGAGDKKNRVEMRFETTGDNETLVQISESGWDANDAELKMSYSNCMGWSQMLFALKAYAEYGINLRKGAYAGLYTAKDHDAKSA